MTTNRMFRITKSPFRLFQKSVPVASCCSLGGENWIALDVGPVRRSGWEMAAQAVFLLARRDVVGGRGGFEERRSPLSAPQGMSERPPVSPLVRLNRPF